MRIESSCNTNPRFASINLTNILACDSILFSDNTVNSALSQFTFNCLNLFFGKLRKQTSFTMHWILSILIKHISHIVTMCAQKQMSRITAGRIVAMVQDKTIFRNSTIGQNPCKSVSNNIMSFITKTSISSSAFNSYPIPAIIWTKYVNLIPKATGIGAVKLMNYRKSDNRFTIRTDSGYSSGKHKT